MKSLTFACSLNVIQFMNWNAELAYFVTPRSGPMRAMRTLRDINQALLDDVPARSRYQRHWFIVGRLLMRAAQGTSRIDLLLVNDALLVALEIEGWMGSQACIKKAEDRSVDTAPDLVPETAHLQLPLPLAA